MQGGGGGGGGGGGDDASVFRVAVSVCGDKIMYWSCFSVFPHAELVDESGRGSGQVPVLGRGSHYH